MLIIAIHYSGVLEVEENLSLPILRTVNGFGGHSSLYPFCSLCDLSYSTVFLQIILSHKTGGCKRDTTPDFHWHFVKVFANVPWASWFSYIQSRTEELPLGAVNLLLGLAKITSFLKDMLHFSSFLTPLSEFSLRASCIWLSRLTSLQNTQTIRTRLAR